MQAIEIDDTFASWRAAALRAIAAGMAPALIEWRVRGDPMRPGGPAPALSLFDTREGTDTDTDTDTDTVSPPAHTVLPDEEPLPGGEASAAGEATISVSRELRVLLGDAALFDDVQRWAFLYRVLWRWTRGERHVASPADEDGARLHRMAKGVRRDKHDMMAYVRFQQRPAAAGAPEYVAWYEPAHDILAWGAEYFAQRMGRTSWLITTPRGAALWDGAVLRIERRNAVAADHAHDHADRSQALWLTYYQSIFNPARLNESALEQNMPVRYWKGLPESRLIPAMVSEARSGSRQLAQARAVGAMGRVSGKVIPVDAERAQPVRDTATTLDACRRCELWRAATQAVPGAGPAAARIMVIGEQPGDQEDLAGRAFVGPAGQLLDTALQRAGLPRAEVYLTNAVKHFKWEPRGKRRLHKTPQQREIEACGHWLDGELDAVRPAVVVTLGATALTALLKRRVALTPYLDAPFTFAGRWVLATYHPAYALRQSAAAQRDAALDTIVAALARAQALVDAPIDGNALLS
ncbi:UdgX family uracil-DNA binding protein [Robbsia sp. Bb-Pol-6]|uniref:Type-4 uracil-DNA glycosylase n=1 Tax=Robbsia betulipollinis TaxID=2981849 RepID=A0ABT3ZN55_9BURK|nr:UdgX family uracil-DNA binding protein [Robbsia betulipollinis]MCY0387969.1 UdgX family uracil-DNA binding protein [Robbsia betulipollinis]